MTDLTESQQRALQIAHNLVDEGVPIFAAFPNSSTGDFLYPSGWQNRRPTHQAVDFWKPGMALCMVTGVVADVLDTDPRNGGDKSRAEIEAAGDWPMVFGVARTASGGIHEIIARTHLAKGSPARGIDLQAGDDRGEGRGFVFIAPTVRPSKAPENAGQPVEYRWEVVPDLELLREAEDQDRTAIGGIVSRIQAKRGTRAASKPSGTPAAADDDAAFDTPDSCWDAEAASDAVDVQLETVRAARENINSTLGGAARFLGRFVPALISEEQAARLLLEALAEGGYHSDAWNAANGKKWTAAGVVAAGLARGQLEPFTVIQTAPEPEVATPEVQPARPGGQPRLQVGSAAEMAYWLQNEIGVNALSGFFRHGGHLVHTPRVNEAGYVPARNDTDDNGPVQISQVTPDTLAAKLQFLYECYKVQRGKDGAPDRDVPAMFPIGAAKAVVNAPEALPMLRPLNGVTLTPMVRPDGSIVSTPGYDPASGYLFLPTSAMNVPPVPEKPDAGDVNLAMTLLAEMTEGFPWETADDLANYYGLLLSPMLRMVTPPSYKMFGIGAHQPGSGKTLLADVARIIHGGVLRSEMPDDEPEIKKMTTSVLATTDAPIIHVDNVTGVLRSSSLAGLLTADGEIQERALGSHTNLTFRNDRVWVVTGNNLSLGGDLVRRTIIITIDPDMANPEEREFAIPDLKAWARGNRNRLLWALLVLIRHWVASGRPCPERKQSDSFAAWETAIGGILACAGVPGTFDARSGERAAEGGDDDELAGVLSHIWEQFQDGAWTSHSVLEGGPHDFVDAGRDWLPSPVLAQFAKSEASGRKSLGRWLLNRRGRWVTTEHGPMALERTSAPTARVASWVLRRRG